MKKNLKALANANGKIYYGMHFYPGVAEYADEESGKSYRIFINEKTIRQMNPSFAGCPVFVQHVDEVSQDRKLLQAEADGWVVESFYNAADGKTWVKFIIVTDEGERAIERGMKLSNAYVPETTGPGGLWNGVKYEQEVIGGEYEHLAIVDNPRYEESIILTPEEFKNYCEDNELELKKLANSKKKEKTEMKLSFFKKEKLKNQADFEEMSVKLPKSGVEKTILQLVNEADEAESQKDEVKNAEMSDMVKVGENEMSVEELIEKYNSKCDEVEAMKPEHNEDDEIEDDEVEDDEVENEDDEVEEDEEAKKKAMEIAEHEDDEIEKAKKKENAKDKKRKNFNKLKNANKNRIEGGLQASVDLSSNQVQRGKARYGSKH